MKRIQNKSVEAPKTGEAKQEKTDSKPSNSPHFEDTFAKPSKAKSGFSPQIPTDAEKEAKRQSKEAAFTKLVVNLSLDDLATHERAPKIIERASKLAPTSEAYERIADLMKINMKGYPVLVERLALHNPDAIKHLEPFGFEFHNNQTMRHMFREMMKEDKGIDGLWKAYQSGVDSKKADEFSKTHSRDSDVPNLLFIAEIADFYDKLSVLPKIAPMSDFAKMTDSNGRTVLHEMNGWFLSKSTFIFLDQLLAAGADPNVKDNSGKTPLDLLAERGYDKPASEYLAKAMIDAGGPQTSFDFTTFVKNEAVKHVPKGVELNDLALEQYINESLKLGDGSLPAAFEGWAFALPKIIGDVLSIEEAQILEEARTLREAPENLEAYLQSYVNRFPKSHAAKKRLAQERVWIQMQKNEKTKHISKEELWRYLIDGNKQNQGPYSYENECGYIIGGLNGLAYGLQSYDEKADADWYLSLQDTIVENVLNRGGKPVPKGYSTGQPSYGVDGMDSDSEGLKDLSERGAKAGNPFAFSSNRVKANLSGAQEYFTTTDALFKKTRDYLKNDRSNAERLMAYVWQARELEIGHKFSDANGRSTNILLASMIAKDKNLPMVMLENPNVLDVNGPEKLLCRVLQGMDNFTKDGKAQTFQKSNAAMHLSEMKFEDPKIEALRIELTDFIQGKESWDYHHKNIGS